MRPRSGEKEADQSDRYYGANDDRDARRRQRWNWISCWRSLRASMRLLPLFHHWTEPRNMLEGYLCEPQKPQRVETKALRDAEATRLQTPTPDDSKHIPNRKL